MLKNRITTVSRETLVQLQKMLDESDAEEFVFENMDFHGVEYENTILTRDFMVWTISNLGNVFAACPDE